MASLQPALEAGRLLRGAQRILVLTGAGISVESGLPTYRGPTRVPSLSSVFRNAAAFGADRERGLRMMDQLHRDIQHSAPNAAHFAVAELARAPGRQVLVATQNIDGLHEAANTPLVSRLHGRLGEIWTPDAAAVAQDANATATSEYLLRGFDALSWAVEVSNKAGGRVRRVRQSLSLECGPADRPNVLLFGEGYGARRAACDHFLRSPVDAVFIVGCSGGVPIVRELALQARQHGAKVVLVNPFPEELFCADVVVPLPATLGCVGAVSAALA